MDGLQFTAELVNALAWPAAVLGVSFMFHKDIRALLPKIKKGKGFGIEVELVDAAVDAAVAAASSQTDDSSPPPANQPPGATPLLAETPDTTRAIIVKAYEQIERRAMTLAQTRKIDSQGIHGLFPSHAIKDLATSRILRPNLVLAIETLRKVRNRVLTERDLEPSSIAAEKFLASATIVARNLDRLIAERVDV